MKPPLSDVGVPNVGVRAAFRAEDVNANGVGDEHEPHDTEIVICASCPALKPLTAADPIV
jgi:hypothetical protein